MKNIENVKSRCSWSDGYFTSAISKAQYFDTLAVPTVTGNTTVRGSKEFRISTIDTSAYFLYNGTLVIDRPNQTLKSSFGSGFNELEVMGDTVFIGGADSTLIVRNMTVISRWGVGVNDMVSSNHLLYAATNNGLKVFDGSNWTQISSSTMGLNNDTLKLVARCNYGIYVMDASGAISVLHNGQWAIVPHPAFTSLPKVMLGSSSKIYIPQYSATITGTNYRSFVPNYSNNDVCLKLLSPGSTLILPLLQSSASDFLLTINYQSQYPVLSSSFPVLANEISNDSIDDTHAIYINDTLATAIKDLFNTLNFTYATSSNRNCYLFIDDLDNFYLSIRSGIKPYVIRLKALPMSNGIDPGNCDNFLNTNNVSARCWNSGVMFWDLQGSSLYEVPKGSGKRSIFSNGLWIGGKDASGNLHMAAQTYRQSGLDYWPGPLDTILGTIDSVTSVAYDSLWKIDRSVVNDFLYHFHNGDVQNGTYAIPEIIRNWPANGSIYNSRSLAPYRDVNSDGVYNPLDGDYPDFIGSQLIWNVFNDKLGIHTETGSQYPLGVEVRQSSYAFNCPNLSGFDTVLNYTTFYHYDLINRSSNSYHDVYIGIHTDVDLGNPLDDYVGCDTLYNYAYCYNGDNDDEGINGYGLNPPMINILTLKGPLADVDGIDNDRDGTTDEFFECLGMTNFLYYNNDFTNIGNPVTANHYYDYLKSVWKDGSPLVYGGVGYLTPGSDSCKFMFSGLPYTGLGWSEQTPEPGGVPNEPGDRRFVTSSGPFSFAPGEKRSLDIAYVYTRDPNNPNGRNTSFSLNQQQVIRIKQMFDTGVIPCDNVISVAEVMALSFSITPNPASGHFNIDFASDGLKTVTISNALGQTVVPPLNYNEKKIMLDISSFPAGIYFVNVKQKNSSTTKKIITY